MLMFDQVDYSTIPNKLPARFVHHTDQRLLRSFRILQSVNSYSFFFDLLLFVEIEAKSNHFKTVNL